MWWWCWADTHVPGANPRFQQKRWTMPSVAEPRPFWLFPHRGLSLECWRSWSQRRCHHMTATVSFLSDGAEHWQMWCRFMHRSGRSAQHNSSWLFFVEFGETEGTWQGFWFQEEEDGGRWGVCMCVCLLNITWRLKERKSIHFFG